MTRPANEWVGRVLDEDPLVSAEAYGARGDLRNAYIFFLRALNRTKPDNAREISQAVDRFIRNTRPKFAQEMGRFEILADRINRRPSPPAPTLASAVPKEAQRILDEYKNWRRQNPAKLYHVALDLRKHGAIVGAPGSWDNLLDDLSRAATAHNDVTVEGPTGTGKELVARAFHHYGRGDNGEFVPIDLETIPKDLLASALFGAEKGAWTGCDKAQSGYFRQAHGGTAFLDELQHCPVEFQKKLLRVLEDKHVTPVGASQRVQVDVLVIAASIQPFDDLLKNGQLLDPLYYRLGKPSLKLLPLNRRRGDIPHLVHYFIEKKLKEIRLAETFTVNEDAILQLIVHEWPGNVRDLRTAVNHAVAKAVARRPLVFTPADFHLTPSPAGQDAPAVAGAPSSRMFGEVAEKALNALRFILECGGDIPVMTERLAAQECPLGTTRYDWFRGLYNKVWYDLFDTPKEERGGRYGPFEDHKDVACKKLGKQRCAALVKEQWGQALAKLRTISGYKDVRQVLFQIAGMP